jgi:protein-tyrosine phosphatase
MTDKIINENTYETTFLKVMLLFLFKDIILTSMKTPSHDFCKAISEAFLLETLDEQNFHQHVSTLKSERSKVLNPISRMHLDRAHRLLDPLDFDHFRAYAVIPGALYAGEIPSSINDDELERKIQTLYDLEVTHIVNLTEVNETNFKAIPLRQYAQFAENYYEEKGREVHCLRYPIRDLNVPTTTQMRSTIEALNNILEEGGCAYLHCWGGIGRTGTVLGCLLLQNEILDHTTAIPYISFLKRNTNIRHRISPETIEQCDFVRNWDISSPG